MRLAGQAQRRQHPKRNDQGGTLSRTSAHIFRAISDATESSAARSGHDMPPVPPNSSSESHSTAGWTTAHKQDGVAGPHRIRAVRKE